jgi:lipopolysaccharide assembly protein A
MKFVAYFWWVLRGLLFLAIFLLALMNTDSVTLRFFLGKTWETPMVLALLVFLILGAALGVLACLPRVFRQRHEIAKLRRELNAAGDRVAPPQT